MKVFSGGIGTVPPPVGSASPLRGSPCAGLSSVDELV